MGPIILLLGIVLAAILSSAATWALRPILCRYALATPNARSSHKIPTPQGGGIAVISATMITAGALFILSGSIEAKFPVPVFGATLFITAVGFADDIKPIPVFPRLILQALAVGAVLFTLPAQLQIVPSCPLWVERGIVLVAGLWFVNLVNFMDGLDLMTVAETVPIAATMIILGLIGGLTTTTLFAAALLGAILGFAPFNRPVAQIFLGDVGSLPIGLLLGWCLLELAYQNNLTAALLLPLYYLADATVTMFRRLAAGETIWTAHRSHYYQRATDNGFTVTTVVGTVLALNLVLVGFAVASTMTQLLAVRLSLLAAGAIAVGGVMFMFSRRRVH